MTAAKTKKVRTVKKKTRAAWKIADNPEVQKKLLDCLWITAVGRFSETEALAYINSGELGYYPQTKEEETEGKFTPITIGHTTYHEYKTVKEDPIYQTKEAVRLFRDEYIDKIISRFKMFEVLEAKSFKALESETQPHRQQMIINGMFRNSPYLTSLLDIIKQVIERNMMPFPDNPGVIKILEAKGIRKKDDD